MSRYTHYMKQINNKDQLFLQHRKLCSISSNNQQWKRIYIHIHVYIYLYMHVCSAVSNSLRPYGFLPARLLCPWDFPGKNAGVGCHFLLQGVFLTQGLQPHHLHWHVYSLLLSRLGSPYTLRHTHTHTHKHISISIYLSHFFVHTWN